MSLLRGFPWAQALIIATLSERENIAAQFVLRTDTGAELVRTPAYEAYLNAH